MYAEQGQVVSDLVFASWNLEPSSGFRSVFSFYFLATETFTRLVSACLLVRGGHVHQRFIDY
jgi:hypothetical protein